MKPMLTILFIFLSGLASAAIVYGPYHVGVVSVYDGDTFTADINLWPGLTQRISVRVRGVDTPELKGSGACEKTLAIAARDFTQAALNSGVVMIDNVVPDKYGGRVDANVSIDGKLLSDMLIAAGHGRAYFGGTRSTWCA